MAAAATTAAATTDPAVLVEEAMRCLDGRYGYTDDAIRAAPAVRAILNASADVRRQCILIAARQPQWDGTRLLGYIARKRAGLTLADIEAILPSTVNPPDSDILWVDTQRLAALAGQIEATWKSLNDEEKTRLRPQLDRVASEGAASPVVTRLRRLTTAAGGDRVPYELIEVVSEVGKALRSVLTGAPEPDEPKAELIRLLACYPITGKPRPSWLAAAGLARGALRQPAETIAALLDAAVDAPEYEHRFHSTYTQAGYVTKRDEAFLCGISVLAGQAAADCAELLPRLRRLALKAIAFIGDEYGHPRSGRLANHCVQAIAAAALPSSITELVKMERGTRHGSLLRQVRRAVDELAAGQGLTRTELLEMAVEDHGLSLDGNRHIPLADGWLAIIQADARVARLGYQDPGGKPHKSLPSAIRQASADALAIIGKDIRAVRVTIGNERARLDTCLAEGRSWPVRRWRELYFHHPVTGPLTRALIWAFSVPSGTAAITGIPVSGQSLITVEGAQAPIPRHDGTEVRLWHPVHAAAGEVRAWRQLLLDRQLAQPVKQAFREVYVVTPAEEATRDYSNRFAGHIFGQEQARALMKGRSWVPVSLGSWDDGVDQGVARREYAQADGQPPVRAEFFFDPVDEDHAGSLYRYCASDQVRFFGAAAEEPIPLAEVAMLTFSEAMRDVDLFIGVTSVGADPEWLDRGGGRRFSEYWHGYAFGDLGARAEIRREVLTGLVPMLAIAERCELESRFLKVRGDLRTYRIHLGSGNILMSPDDQYLCIVAARDARAGKLFLPFDDDPILSLILSKAFLLADDTNITDRSITRQISAR